MLFSLTFLSLCLCESETPAPKQADRLTELTGQWIPIANNGGGDYFCLDLVPAKGGVVGQVILFGHEGTDQRRVARSFGEWMSKLAGRFQAGKIAFDEDEGLVEE